MTLGRFEPQKKKTLSPVVVGQVRTLGISGTSRKFHPEIDARFWGDGMELEKIKRFSGILVEPFREAFKLVNTFAGRLPGRFIWFAVVIFRLSSCIPENAKTIKSNR